MALEIDLPTGYQTYRALRHPWRTTLFTTDVETLDFGFVAPGNEITKQITVTSHADRELNFTCVETTDPAYTVDVGLPLTLQPGESFTVDVTFFPDSEDDFSAKLYVKTTAEQEMIAQDVFLSGAALDGAASSESFDVAGPVPARFALYPASPNPFSTSTAICFDLPVTARVSLEIYDLRGRRVDTVVEGELAAGRHTRSWQPERIRSGLYFARFAAGDFTATRKFLIMR
jgi:hypothetical protein